MVRKLFPVGVFLLVLVVSATAVHYFVDRYISRDAVVAGAVSCAHLGADHIVTISQARLSSTNINGKLCDRLTITNEDSRLRLMAFGRHDHHRAYDSVVERLLSQGQSLTVTMDQPGRFTFHDHLDDAVVGYFTVSK